MPSASSDALTVAESSSLRLTLRTTLAAGSRLISGRSSLPGLALVSREVALRTRNCITWPVVPTSAGSNSSPTSPPPKGSSGPTLRRMMRVPRLTLEKSTITSARSAGAMSSCLSLTGLGRYPPSLPICVKGMPLLILRMRNRDCEPLSRRRRYRRCSTFRYGQVLPFTTIVLPKNSGFHCGEMSLIWPSSAIVGLERDAQLGRAGELRRRPGTFRPSKKARLSG